MPVPPEYQRPASGAELDDEPGVIYNDPTSPPGMAGYYVILDRSPGRKMTVEVPSERMSPRIWRLIEEIRDEASTTGVAVRLHLMA